MWVWWLLGSLDERERIALDHIAETGGIHLPAFCLWEARMLHSKGRIKPPTPFSTGIRQPRHPMC